MLGLYPYVPEAELRQRYAPLAEVIRSTLGRPVIIKIGSTYAEQLHAVGHDRIDIAVVGPSAYVKILDQYGHKPVLAQFELAGKPEMHGVIIVRRDSPIRTIDDLRGRRFAFGDPESSMSWYVPMWVMLRHGVSLRTLGDHGTLGSNADIALAVLTGDYDAGAVTFAIYERYANSGLRVLEDLPRTPNLMFLTRADFPPADVERLRRALQALHTTADGRTVLHALHSDMTALIPGNDDAFGPLRSIMQTVLAAE